jgi:hypothetical protein
VNGEMSAGERDKLMDRYRGAFSVAPEAAVSNVRCLGEGIDLPEVDAVVFTAPRQSRIDIAQICGRVQRRSPGKDGAPDKTCGYVVIPVFLDLEALEDGGATPEEVIDRTIFGPTFKTLSVISETDEPFADDVRDLLVQIGMERHGGNDLWGQHPPLDGLEVIGLDGLLPLTVDLLIRSISLRLAHEIGDLWDEMFGRLLAYRDQYGDCLVPEDWPDLGGWVSRLRDSRKSGRKCGLTEERIQRLDAIGFVWDTVAHRWDVKFTELVEYKNEHGHANVPQRPSTKLRTWVDTQRNRKKRLSSEQVQRLDALGFGWDPHVAVWNTMREKLEGFKLSHGHCLVLDDWSSPWQVDHQAANAPNAWSPQHRADP